MEKTSYLELPTATFQALSQEARRRDLSPADFVSLIFNHYAISYNQLKGFEDDLDPDFVAALQAALTAHQGTLDALEQD